MIPRKNRLVPTKIKEIPPVQTGIEVQHDDRLELPWAQDFRVFSGWIEESDARSPHENSLTFSTGLDSVMP